MNRIGLKIFCVFLVIILALPLCMPTAQANSAPGEPSTITSAFTVAKDNTIVVQNELLTFRVDPQNEKAADVTADYTMSNSSSSSATVNMLFPSTGDMQNPEVMLDGVTADAAVTHLNILNYENPAPHGKEMDIDNIIDFYNLGKEDYEPKKFKTSDVLNVFDVTAKESTVIFPEGSTLIDPHADWRYINGNMLKITSSNFFRLYLLGGNSLQINGQTVVPNSHTTFRDFALLCRDSQDASFSEHDYLNQFYRQLDYCMQFSNIITDDYLLVENISEFTVLCYQVGFAADATRDVKVSYRIQAGHPMGGPEKSEYDYLLNPAKYWAGFQRLEIDVFPGPQRNAVAYSSLPLKRQPDGSYKGVFNSLPQDDLVFDLSALTNFQPVWVSIFTIATVALILIILIMILFWRKHKVIRNL